MRQDSASAKKMVTFSILLQLKQLDPQSAQSVESVKTLYVMKSRPLKAEPSSSLLKSKALDGDQRADMFHEVRPRSHATANVQSAPFFSGQTQFSSFILTT